MVEDALGKPLGVGRLTSKVPRRIRRALKRRDGDGCRFPACTNTRFIDAHHIEHWADGGPTDLDNLVLLCRFHHRLVHEVGYRIVVDGSDALRFQRPDGTAIPDLPAPAPAGAAAALEAANGRQGLSITPWTLVPDWDGTPQDYSTAVGVLADVSAETP